MKKLYCYVDETGQDTEGQLFIVVSVIVSDERHSLNAYLEQSERTSGIGKKKWVRAKTAKQSRDQYIASLDTAHFGRKIFFSRFTDAGTGAYEHLTVLTIAQAVNLYRERLGIKDDYKLSVTIDGLKRAEELGVGKQLRELGVASKKVRGARDESEPMIRLADRIAGLVRDAENDPANYKALRRTLERKGIITKL